jgi:hypothetical protein
VIERWSAAASRNRGSAAPMSPALASTHPRFDPSVARSGAETVAGFALATAYLSFISSSRSLLRGYNCVITTASSLSSNTCSSGSSVCRRA